MHRASRDTRRRPLCRAAQGRQAAPPRFDHRQLRHTSLRVAPGPRAHGSSGCPSSHDPSGPRRPARDSPAARHCHGSEAERSSHRDDRPLLRAASPAAGEHQRDSLRAPCLSSMARENADRAGPGEVGRLGRTPQQIGQSEERFDAASAPLTGRVLRASGSTLVGAQVGPTSADAVKPFAGRTSAMPDTNLTTFAGRYTWSEVQSPNRRCRSSRLGS